MNSWALSVLRKENTCVIWQPLGYIHSLHWALKNSGCEKHRILAPDSCDAYERDEFSCTQNLTSSHIEKHTAAAAATSLQSCLTLCDPIEQQPTRLPRPWDSPDKNTGVGCHFLLQCMKVKSESKVAQLCLTLSDPMERSFSGSSVHGIFQAGVLEWGAIAFFREKQ